MLTRFGFRGKMYYLCICEEERARKYWVFSSFLPQKSHFYLRDRFFYITEIFFLEFADFFCNVGCIFANEERLKLKRYLFSKPHFLLFEEGRGELRQYVLNIYSCNNAYADVFQNSYDEISLNYIFP